KKISVAEFIISRRGTPSIILSDNVITFKEAHLLLEELREPQQSHQEMREWIADHHITWHFITPLSSWRGVIMSGWWAR
ncbi:unnamed protein product, partial [Enterobius vermicularis]|uniref:Integrase catalytic domain-containing protein n=1 Tax=Enterobius vermicularis TaxID=51028 RepID=A0A0N4VQT1_ENTVE